MENDVPLGDFRTSVKYVEKGRFPEVRRHFTVLRCNHCDAAPCVDICPVNALHKRPDAIVDLDRDLCIGCTACMQACPYDAIYLKEDNGVAEKCHYCAHRTELGLEPACVNVCPVEAIISGPVNEPESTISQYIANHKTSRRKLEKGTRPRLWYVDALEEALLPGSAAEPQSYLWSERPAEPPPVVPGFEPTPDILTTFDDAHKATWGAHIVLYILAKNICAGALMVAPLLGILGVAEGFMRDVLPEVVGLIFLVFTNALLVHDLGRPERFYEDHLSPQYGFLAREGCLDTHCLRSGNERGTFSTTYRDERGSGHSTDCEFSNRHLCLGLQRISFSPVHGPRSLVGCGQAFLASPATGSAPRWLLCRNPAKGGGLSGTGNVAARNICRR